MTNAGVDARRAWSSVADQLICPIIFPTRRLRLLALLLSSTLVFMLFYLGTKPLPGGMFSHPWDKAVHYLFFGGLAGMFWVMWGGTRIADLMAVAMTLSVGIADEWTQAYNPARSSSLGDLTFDLLGALTAVLVLSRLRHTITKGRPLTGQATQAAHP
ncbi:MAG: VanZ family protein [Burkholderiaceae bacterium]